MKFLELFAGTKGVSSLTRFNEEHRKKLSESAKRRCTPEWRKQKSIDYSTKLDIAQIKEMYSSGMTQKEIAESLCVTQKIIWRAMKNNGIKSRVASKRNQTGSNNDHWKGGRASDKGYIKVVCSDHPRASQCGGYVYEHDLVMEKHIERNLRWNGSDDPDSEVVHHINRDKSDNRLENLMLLTSSQHTSLHNRERLKKVKK